MASTKKTIYRVLQKPLITEKTASQGGAVFAVHPDANKIEIRKAVEKIFDVKVTAVRTANMMGKKKRVGQKVGKQKDWKKAYVSLAEGSNIEIIEGL